MESLVEAEQYIAKLEEELDRFKNGYQGGCYACEIVGEKNVALREASQTVVNKLRGSGGINPDAADALLKLAALLEG